MAELQIVALEKQRIYDVSKAEREFKGNVEELGVLGTTLEHYLKHYRSFDKSIFGLKLWS